MPGGRRDGNVSVAQETSGNLPPPTASVKQLNQIFGAKGLSQSNMAALSGAHTIGMGVAVQLLQQSAALRVHRPNATWRR